MRETCHTTDTRRTLKRKLLGMGIYKNFLLVATLPLLLATYFRSGTGKEYGIGLFTKIIIMFRMVLNNFRIESGTNFIEHLIMAARILNTPKSLEGCVVECGTYKGGSAVNLSLICALTGRTLELFDSFEGLPTGARHTAIGAGEAHLYEKGGWRGTLDEARRNIARHGAIEVCAFHQGYFDATLPGFAKRAVFVFLDVDLRESLEVCVRQLWPRLADGCYLYTHEAFYHEIALLFYDNQWWRDNLDATAPGLVGAGNGLGLFPRADSFGSSLGYTVKNPAVASFELVTPGAP